MNRHERRAQESINRQHHRSGTHNTLKSKSLRKMQLERARPAVKTVRTKEAPKEANAKPKTAQSHDSMVRSLKAENKALRAQLEELRRKYEVPTTRKERRQLERAASAA